MGPGAKSPPYPHSYPQISYTFEGNGRATIEGQAFNVGPGHVLRLVNCKAHAIVNDGPWGSRCQSLPPTEGAPTPRG